MTVKALVKDFVARSGLLSLRLRSTSRLRVLMYHGVSSRSLPPERLEEQLVYIKRYFDTYWASEIPDILNNLGAMNRPAVVLTFDDGLRNNVTFAAPLLEKHNVKATFYLVSDLLDGNSMLWNHEIRCRLALMGDEKLPPGVGPFASARERRWEQVGAFVESMKHWDPAARLELLYELRKRLPAPPYEEWMREEFLIMSEEEARNLPSLVEVGSHTRTHPLLDQLSEEAAELEIDGSRRRLESITGKPVKTFCYPNGQLSSQIVEIVKRRYSAAVTVEQGVVVRGDALHRLNRIIAGENLKEFIYYLSRPMDWPTEWTRSMRQDG